MESFERALSQGIPPEDSTGVLTSTKHQLLQTEVELLRHLVESDDALDALVDLWAREREDSSVTLISMEEHCSDGLREEEAALRKMMENYGNDWVEPQARLALLLFVRGMYDEAIHLSQSVLSIKPWHFETAQLLVVLYLRQNNWIRKLLERN